MKDLEKIITGILIVVFLGWLGLTHCCSGNEDCECDKCEITACGEDCTKECCADDKKSCGEDCEKECCADKGKCCGGESDDCCSGEEHSHEDGDHDHSDETTAPPAPEEVPDEEEVEVDEGVIEE